MTQRLFILAQLSVLALATTVGACVGGVAQAADEIRIGVLTALTGPTAKFGQGQKNAWTIALEEINGTGGIASLGGAKITLEYGDTRGNGDTGATETERLITEEKVVAVIGAFQSGVAMPSSAAAGSAGQFRHGRHPDAARVQVHLPSACAALMGIAGAVLVPFYYTHPAVGTTFLLKAFVTVVLGGLGSMVGAALGGLLVGTIEGVVAPYTQAAVAQIILFALFILMLFVRPGSLFGVEQR